MKFKNKKGFTLIEIIICIGVLAIVGVASILGINYVSNNIRISKLKDIEDEIMTAARIYMETHNEVDYQLNKNNTMILPLNVLVNEGLLDLTTTELDVEDVSKEYIIAALASGGKDETCVNITEGSWNLSKDNPIYICTDSNGSSNLAIINPSSMSNANKVMKEPYVFKGLDPNNYVQFTKDGTNHLFRVYYVDIDDTLVVYDSVKNNKTSLEYIFQGKSDNLCGNISGSAIIEGKLSNELMFNKPCEISDNSAKLITSVDLFNTASSMESFHYGDLRDMKMSVKNANYSDKINLDSIFSSFFDESYHYNTANGAVTFGIYNNFGYYKIRLKSCMKITGGTGNKAKPFILDDQCNGI